MGAYFKRLGRGPVLKAQIASAAVEDAADDRQCGYGPDNQVRCWLETSSCRRSDQSVHTERNHRVDLGRAPRREVSCNQRHPE